MVVPTKVRNQTCPPVVTFLKRIINVQIELNGNMLSLHMHLESHSQNGEMVIQSVSLRRGKKFKGRKCAEKMNKEYKRMQADMYNLYPAIGEVNGRRSNYSMAIIKGEEREFGQCDVEIKRRKVEPKESIRGEIARTYMYIDSVHPGRGIISKKNRKLFESSNQSDPVDKWECERARRIERIQGNRNEVVLENC